MIEIGEEFYRFKKTSERPTDQIRMMILKVWFPDFEILKKQQQMNRETCPQDTNTRIETVNIEKRTLKHSNLNITYTNTEQTITQKEKMFRNYKENDVRK